VSRLDEIGVRVIPAEGEEPEASALSGNTTAILNEVLAALANLNETGETTLIDLNSLPLTAFDSELLRETLAEGEVHARIDAIGPTEVRETIYPGVWWVTHYNVEGDIVADVLEITRVPEILKSHPDDVRDSLTRLRELLDGADREALAASRQEKP
jgi:hydrogenase-1 operon protein HyaF